MAPRSYLYIWLCTIFFIGCSTTLVGQSFSADTVKLLHQDSIAYKILLSDPDSSIRIANATLREAVALRNEYLEGFSYYLLSKGYWAKTNYRFSAEYGFKALRIFENSSHNVLWGKSLLSLARTFIDLKTYEHAGVYINRAITLANNSNNTPLLAEAFRENSMLFSETRNYDSAIYYADKGLALFEQLHDSTSISILYGRKAKIYFYKGDYKQSSAYNRKSFFMDSLVGNKRALGITYYQAALDAIHLNNFDSAIILLKQSIPINQEIRNVNTLIKVHNLLADIYIEQKKPEIATKQLKIASQYKDSLYNIEKSGQIQQMISLYELSSKEKTIEQLAEDNVMKAEQVVAQRWFAGFLLVCVLLLAVGIYFMTRYRRLQERTNAQLALKNRDIEQQKEEIQSQAETLQELNQLKSKLFSVISHDLRGPMATLHSLLDLLSRKKLSPDEFVSVSDKLKNNLDLTQRTLENLLNWSLSQMEGIKTEPKTLNIKETIDEACHLMGEVAHRKNVQIQSTTDGLLVRADSDQLQLILRNLIHNAIKFSKPYDEIFISASQNSSYCLVSVKDKGIGMSKAEIDTVVTSRNYFSKTGTMQEKGTGLGLLLCKEFIKLNGGEINIRSGINQGTEVTFTVPLALAQPVLN